MKIQNDTLHMLEESGWTQQRLSKEAALNPSALSKFLSRKNGSSIAERLVPFIYGEKRPPAKDSQR